MFHAIFKSLSMFNLSDANLELSFNSFGFNSIFSPNGFRAKLLKSDLNLNFPNLQPFSFNFLGNLRLSF